MNILFYIPTLNQEDGGIRQYSLALLKILSQDEENKYYVWHIISDNEIKKIIQKSSNLKLVEDTPTLLQRALLKIYRIGAYISSKLNNYNISFQLLERTFEDSLMKKYSCEILYSPYQLLPKTSFKRICTLHDVQELHFPEFFTSQERAFRAVNYKYSIDNADNIIVSYKHVKDDIAKYFNKNAENIHVCLLNMQYLWFEHLTNNDIQDISSYISFEKFLLYPAASWEHKNHMKLLEAINYLKVYFNIEINLVCTGHLTEHYNKNILPYLSKQNLKRNVIFTGVINERILFSLYKRCIGVVIPTLYEAGSFPLMESLLMNIPVICSNITSLPETIGNKDYTFNPIDLKEIYTLINKLWNDNKFREANRLNTYEQSAKLRTNNALLKIKKVIRATKQKY